MKKALSGTHSAFVFASLMGLQNCNNLTDINPIPELEPRKEIVQDPQVETNKNQAIKIMAFSDFNVNTSGTYNSATRAIVSNMIQRNPALILGAGDYIDGEKTSLSKNTYTKMWSSFFENILKPMLNAKVAFLPSPGNHDAYYSNERTYYSEFWNPKKPNIEYVDARNYPFYYSFKKDNVLFISLDSSRYSALYNRQTQLKWLEAQLTSKDAQAARARVVYGHIPLYSVASKSANSSVIYQNGALVQERASRSSFSLEALLLKHKVDLVIFGHSHSYFGGEYTYPNGQTLNVISLPCAGGTQRFLAGTSIKSKYGFVEININEANKMSYQFYDSKGEAQSDLNLPTSILLDSTTRVRYYKKD